jgi:hypothetical protein
MKNLRLISLLIMCLLVPVQRSHGNPSDNGSQAASKNKDGLQPLGAAIWVCLWWTMAIAAVVLADQDAPAEAFETFGSERTARDLSTSSTKPCA